MKRTADEWLYRLIEIVDNAPRTSVERATLTLLYEIALILLEIREASEAQPAEVKEPKESKTTRKAKS